jgi:hypothetical protein
MTQYEYVTATSGVLHCACIPCSDMVYGYSGELCSECESVGCEPLSNSCERDDIYEEC